jgi:hypothetical protein
MAGVSDKQLVRMPGWPAGVDNLSPENDLARDESGKSVIAVRAAENVDLSKGGKPRRREGFALALAGSRTHSLWRDGELPFALYVTGGTLRAFQPGGGFDIADGLDASLPVSYALAGERVFWSNGPQRGVVLADGTPAPWGCPTPGGQPQVTALAGQGGLAAGRYQVAITWQLASGEEGGAALAVVVDVVEGGGLSLSGFPVPPAEVAAVRIYVSPANGDVLYHALDVAPGLPVVVIGAGVRRKPLDTQLLDTMPGGHIVRWYNGRLFVADEGHLRWSESLRYGLTQPAKNHLGFGGRLDLLEPAAAGSAGGGLYVAAGKRTYWLAGGDPAAFTQQIAYPHGAVSGTSLTVPGNLFGLETANPVPYWLADNGVACLGLPGGQVMPLREGQVVAPSAKRGASLFRERNGLRQVVTALAETAPRGLAMRDVGVMTVERYDR